MFDELIIVFYGKLNWKQSNNRKLFWQKYINIQRSISNINKISIIGHLVDAEYTQLIQNTYFPQKLSSQMHNDAEKFLVNVDSIFSSHKEILQNVFLDSYSQKEALSLIHTLPGENQTVLLTSWNNKLIDSNKIVFDRSLPKDYIYFSYGEDADIGYECDWIWGRRSLVAKFARFHEYLFEAVNSSSTFFRQATVTGWPMSLEPKPWKQFFKKSIKRLICIIIVAINLNKLATVFPQLKKKIVGLQYRVKNFLLTKPLMGENFLLMGTNLQVTYPIKKMINKNSLIKGFVFSEELREQIRFLNTDDFEIVEDGQLIVPLKFSTVFVYMNDPKNISWNILDQNANCMPENCQSLVLAIDEKYKNEIFPQLIGSKKLEIIYIKQSEYLSLNFVSILKNICDLKIEYAYFIPYDMPLARGIDKVYLNSVLHYFANSDESYLSLISTQNSFWRKKHSSFPDMIVEERIENFFSRPGLMQAGKMQECLSRDFKGQSKKFSAVSGQIQIEDSLWVSKYFGHVKIKNILGVLNKNELDQILFKYDQASLGVSDYEL